MKIKHAYLIIAHTDFNLLNMLLQAIDDERNDIFIHIDKKVSCLPQLYNTRANVFVLSDRVDVRWGDYSQILTELKLYDYAFSIQAKLGVCYQYYHLLSGVDLPIKTQDYIHEFCKKHQGKIFLGFYQGDCSLELLRKVGVYHLCPRHFDKNMPLSPLKIIREIFSRLQLRVGIFLRNTDVHLVKGPNWCSITNEFVSYLLEHRDDIKRRYRYSCCGDEIYKQTLCWNSKFKNKVYDLCDEAKGSMRFINWKCFGSYSILTPFDIDDYVLLKESSALFARKFSNDSIEVASRILADVI